MPPPLPALSSLPSLHNRTEPGLGVISGPIATGKSALADRLPGAILSADSRQVYRGFDLGTAQLSSVDRRRVPHYLIDCFLLLN
jgi:tRNA dimethylallyltransferase